MTTPNAPAGFTSTEPIHWLEPLYSKDLAGRIRVWHGGALNGDVVLIHGIFGKKLIEVRQPVEATNVGRSNERDTAVQAYQEVCSRWREQKDKGYFESKEDAERLLVRRPMLAQLYRDCHAKIADDAELVIQPKLNGMRAMAFKQNGKVVLTSRKGKLLTVPHIEAQLCRLMNNGEVWDGELYIHGQFLQRIVSFSRAYRLPESGDLEYHVFDAPVIEELNGNAGFFARYERVAIRIYEETGGQGAIQVVEAKLTRKPELRDLAMDYVANGYEGCMLRYPDAPYAWNHRVKTLLKVKTYVDGEFTIVEVKSRLYNMNGVTTEIIDVVVFQNDITDATFEANVRGPMPWRAEKWLVRDDLIGLPATVRYLERSLDGIPIGNPVMLGLREDLAGETEDEEVDAMWGVTLSAEG